MKSQCSQNKQTKKSIPECLSFPSWVPCLSGARRKTSRLACSSGESWGRRRYREEFLHHLMVRELSKLGPSAQPVHLLMERNFPCHHMLHLP